MRKYLATLMLALVASAATMPSEAVSIGGARGGFSGARPSMPARVTPAPTRIGGGQPIGQSRPDVMSSVRGTTPAPLAAPRPTTTVTTPPAPPVPSTTTISRTTVINQGGGGGGGGFGSSFAGSLVGSTAGTLLGNALSHPSAPAAPAVIAGGAAAVPAAAGATQGAAGAAVAGEPGTVQAAAPGIVYMAAPADTGVSPWRVLWQGLGWLLVLAGAATVVLVLIGAWKGWRNSRSVATANTHTTTHGDTMRTDTPFPAVARFLDVQHAFAGKSSDKLADLLDADMVAQIDLSGDPEQAAFAGISYSVVHQAPDEVSIRYRARDMNAQETIDEVWHFTRAGQRWLLTGIEPV